MTAGSDAGGMFAMGATANAGTENGGMANGGSANAGGDSQAGTMGEAGGGAGGAAPDPTAILEVKPSAGCGKDPVQVTGELVKHTIQTSGTKEPNCAAKRNGQPVCGPWSLLREYYVWLPTDYQKTRAYPLVLQGPGCSGNGTNIYSLSPSNTDLGAGVDGTVIRVGLTPAPNEIGHGTNENQGCFDDKEGDDSVDFVFYETLIDQLKTEVCYDENRVFVSGNSSGAWLANELGCKYAGNADGYAIRGVATNTGGLPTEAQFVPTCSQKPMAGIWVWENGEITAGFSGVKVAIARAMQVAGCTIGSNFDNAKFQDFPIGGGNPDATCKRIMGCPALYPLVACALPGNGHGSQDAVSNPAFARFLQSLAAP